MKQFMSSTFSSLKIRNYRLYFIGQGISLCGTWMQSISQDWLVLKLTGSGTTLGIITAVQFLPVLCIAPWGGVIADRFPKRTILYITQTVEGILALILGLLVLTNTIQLWHVYVLALCLGIASAFDNPTRQTFVLEMVGKDDLHNAVALNTSEINLARVIGPSIAGILITTIGLAPSFLFNALSYIPVLIVLAMMHERELYLSPRTTKIRGQLKEGVRYVISHPLLLHTLIMMSIIGTLTYEFSVSLPLLTQFTFHSEANAYAALTAAMGIGSVLSGLFIARQKKVSLQQLILTAFLFGVTVIAAAIMPTLWLTIAAMAAVGVCSLLFLSLGNVLLQFETDPKMRGRVMSLWTVAFLGTTPIGGPIIGWIGETFGPRYAIGLGGVAALFAALYGYSMFKKNIEKNISPVINPIQVGIDTEK